MPKINRSKINHTWQVLVVYDGINPVLDNTMERVVGKHSSSGFDFDANIRDMEWKFPNKKEAEKVFSKLKRMKVLTSVTIAEDSHEA